MASLIETVRSVIGPGAHALASPWINEEDADNAYRCAHLEPVGYGYIEKFEQELAALTGSHVVAVSSGTAALHLALLAAGVLPGDEVIVPALTFVATANAVVHAGATPHFVDVESQGMGISPFRLKSHLEKIAEQRDGKTVNKQTGKRIAAVIPVHLLGVPCKISEIKAIALRYELTVIEDAAEALGAKVGGKYCGTFGSLGILSFNCNKLVSTGGGGAVLTSDAALAHRVLSLATTAKKPSPFLYDHTEVAWNYRLPNICAALGLGQLKRLDSIIAAKRDLAVRYRQAFARSTVARYCAPPGDVEPNHWVNAVAIHGERDRILTEMLADGLSARALFKPLHTLKQFSNSPRQGAIYLADSIYAETICLPSSVRGLS